MATRATLVCYQLSVLEVRLASPVYVGLVVIQLMGY